MTSHQLCVLCGVAPSGGSSYLSSPDRIDAETKKMANELAPENDEMRQIVHAMLEATDDPMANTVGFPYPWRPEGMGLDRYNEMLHIAIGHFDADGVCERRGELVRDGRGVDVRRVDDFLGDADFLEFVRDADGKEERIRAWSVCTTFGDNPNFMLCEPCFLYLEAWLALDSLPPRSSAFPSDPEPLSLAGELYEIVNSQKELRVGGVGILPAIDYDGIEDTLEQCQDCFLDGRRGVEHIREAIEAGLRGVDLIPALMKDCRTYMFMRPNLYPESPNEDRTSPFTIYHPGHKSTMPLVGNLPNELLLPILHDLEIPSLLALASTCRSLRALILEPSFLDRVLKEAITYGSLRWLLPVEAVTNEKRRAYDTLRLWLPEDHRPDPLLEPFDDDESAKRDSVERRRLEVVVVPPVASLVTSPHFPRLAFVRECWKSDSMRNRRRIWGQVAQFEKLWRDYRLNGWRVNRFFFWSDNTRDNTVNHGQL